MEDAEVDLRRVFGLIRRRLKLIGATVLAVVGLGSAYLIFVTPIYTASSLVILDPQQQDLLNHENRAASNVDNARVESEAELLRSDTILLKVIAAQNLLNDPAFAPSTGLRARLAAMFGFGSKAAANNPDRTGQVLTQLRGAVSIQRRGPTTLIAVQAQSADPAVAAELANAVAQTYIDDQISSKVAALLSARDVLQGRLAEARQEIISAEAQFNTFLQQSTADLASQPGGSDIGRLNEELRALETARLDASQTLDAITASLASSDWNKLAAALSPEPSGALREQHMMLAQQIAGAGSASPQRAEFQQQLSALEAELRSAASGQIENLRINLDEISGQEATVREQLRDRIMQTNLPVDLLTGLYDLQGKSSFAREQYQLLLTRSLELQSQSTLQRADSRIASLALPPSAPSFPSTNLFLAGFTALGLVLGLAFAIAHEAVVGGFMSPEQVEASLKIPVGTSVPRLTLEPGNDTLADLVITAPLSRFAEAMRRMRLVVDHATERAVGCVVMVASALPGEGKTTTAIGLARSYSMSGRKTLLVDCDLRQPEIASSIGIQPKRTLLDLLEQGSGSIRLLDAVVCEADTGLSVLGGTQGTDQPTDRLLAGQRFDQILSQARELFEIVLLDTPAIEPVTDTLYLAPRADLIVLVARWASTPQRDAKQTLAALLQAKYPATPILGVLNASAQTQSGRNKTYRRFYDADYAWAPPRSASDDAARHGPTAHGRERAETITGRTSLFSEQRRSADNSLRDALDELDA